MSNYKAILFGLNYKDTSHELRGCINDVDLMNNCLISYLGVPKSNISIYHDNTDIKPNKDNIIKVLEEGIREVNSNVRLDTLWIHYSGHGSYIWDRNGDEDYIEIDGSLYYGKDEVLCPLDGGYILDDELNLLFSKLNKNKKLICIFDCCHSGTALDLPYTYDYKKNLCRREKNKNLIKCEAILLAGALDSQTAADAPGLSTKYTYTGAFTTAILTACQENVTISLDKIMDYAGKYLEDKGLWQIPQVTSTFKISGRTEFMISGYRVSIIDRINRYNKYIELCDYYYSLYKNEIYKKYKEYFIMKKKELNCSLI